MIKTTNDHLMLSAFGKTVYWVKGVGGGGEGVGQEEVVGHWEFLTYGC